MADNGRISSVVAEPVVTGAAGDAKGRISTVIAEPVVTGPAADAVGRVSAVIVEAAVTGAAGDAKGRISAVIAEPVANEVGPEARVAFLFVSVFSEAPTTTPAKRSSFGGGVQGKKLSSLRR